MILVSLPSTGRMACSKTKMVVGRQDLAGLLLAALPTTARTAEL